MREMVVELMPTAIRVSIGIYIFALVLSCVMAWRRPQETDEAFKVTTSLPYVAFGGLGCIWVMWFFWKLA